MQARALALLTVLASRLLFLDHAFSWCSISSNLNLDIEQIYVRIAVHVGCGAIIDHTFLTLHVHALQLLKNIQNLNN